MLDISRWFYSVVLVDSISGVVGWLTGDQSDNYRADNYWLSYTVELLCSGGDVITFLQTIALNILQDRSPLSPGLICLVVAVAVLKPRPPCHRFPEL